MRYTLIVLLLAHSVTVCAQDKIFTTRGDTLTGKVTEVGDTYIKYTKPNVPDGPLYVVRMVKIDSVVYANGRTEDIVRLLNQRRKPNHLTTNNTLALDLLAPVSNSMALWYERRVWQGRIGIRVPLYLSYGQNYSPGYHGMRIGKAYIQSTQGFACATGINPKFYFNKHKVFRVFAGPEANVGYTRDARGSFVTERNRRYFTNTCNVQAAGMAGININPFARFNVTLEGGAGYTYAFAPGFTQHNPVWRIGLSMGGNF
jgi:hypothetical protein